MKDSMTTNYDYAVFACNCDMLRQIFQDAVAYDRSKECREDASQDSATSAESPAAVTKSLQDSLSHQTISSLNAPVVSTAKSSKQPSPRGLKTDPTVAEREHSSDDLARRVSSKQKNGLPRGLAGPTESDPLLDMNHADQTTTKSNHKWPTFSKPPPDQSKIDKRGRDGILVKNSSGDNCLGSLVIGHKTVEAQKMRFFNALMSLEDLNDQSKWWLLTNEDFYAYNAMEKAAFYGFRDLLAVMLDEYDRLNGPNEIGPVSTAGRTLLHSAADSGRLEIAKFVLERKSSEGRKGYSRIIDQPNLDLDTALHLAARYKHTELVSLLLQKNASLTKFNKKGRTALYSVLGVPGVEEDLCARLDGTLDFEFQKGPNFCKKEKVILKPCMVIMDSIERGNAHREISVLADVVDISDHVAERFLMHPACLTFIELKMQRIRIFYFLDLILYVSYLFFLTWIVAAAGVVRIEFMEATKNVTKVADCSLPLAVSASVFASVRFIINLYFLLVNLLQVVRFTTAIHFPSQPLSENSESIPTDRHKTAIYLDIPVNLLKLLLHSAAVLLLFVDRSKTVEHLFAWELLALWTLLLQRFQIFSFGRKYHYMLKSVLTNFFKVLFAFSPLFMGFLIVFSILFQDKPLLVFPTSFMTFFTMIAGEFNVSDLFGKDDTGLVVSSQVIFTAFVVLVSIVIMNLWIGLSVTDTARLERFGAIQQAKADIKRILQTEEIVALLQTAPVRFPAWVSVLLSRQVNLFAKPENKSRTEKNNPKRNVTKPFEIMLSLKEPNKCDLILQKDSLPNGKVNFSVTRMPLVNAIKENAAICAFKIGIVFHSTILYRQFPIYEYLQRDLQNILTKKRQQKQQ